MRVYLRLGRTIGVSMPWWLAWVPLALWLVGLGIVALVVLFVALGKLAADLVQMAGNRRRRV